MFVMMVIKKILLYWKIGVSIKWLKKCLKRKNKLHSKIKIKIKMEMEIEINKITFATQ